MSKIKAVLFDIDGTLLDTKEFIYQSLEYSLSFHGFNTQKRVDFDSIIGKPLEVCYQILAPSGDIVSLCEQHRAFQGRNYHLSNPFPNTLKTLSTLKNKRVKIAGITTRHSSTLYQTLINAGIKDFFDYVVTEDDVKNHKPHPEPFLKTLKILKVKPDEVLMVGDTDADIKGGKNAGIKTVGALYGMVGERIRDSNPDFLIKDISELIKIVVEV